MKRENLKSSPTGELVLLDPVTGEPHVKLNSKGDEVPDHVTVYGHTPDSAEWKRIERRVLGAVKKQELWLHKKKGAKLELDADTMEKRRVIVIKSITKIDNVEDLGESPEELEAFLTDPLYAWVTEQWEDYIADRANFFKGASKKPASGAKPLAG